ncbi:hypothetical protein A5728_10260 [Kocuria sp. ICS0012]|nr:hypothetical protein A5728_10260 [Kocuria sp. ICS0012]
MLPQLIVDGEDLNFMSQSFGFSGVNATIVWHPGWPIAHAQVDTGRAVRLWPNPYEINFGVLPQVHSRELTFWDGAIVGVGAADELTQLAQHPLSVDSDSSVAVFGVALPSEE